DWKAFPFDQSAFDYSGDKLRQAWPRLTLGFGDYPFPDADWVRRMAEQYPEALQRTTSETAFTGAPEEAEAYAAELQEVWRLLFRGDFAEAKARGLALGVGGQVPAMYAQVRSEEHTSELQSRENLVCRLLLEKKKRQYTKKT